jgi:16S rRNA (cytosine967-C5)-methyltransferase
VLGDLADPRERALATELVYGVTRVRGALDAALAEACHRPLRSLDPAVRAALRLGCYQLRVTDRIPAHAAVGSSVELVRRHGRPEAAGFVNAVLRHLGSTAPAEAGGTAAGLAARHGHPAWLVARWLSRLGPAQTERLLEANNARPAVSLRANVLRATGPALHAELLAAGLEARPGRFLPEAVRVRRAGDPGALDAVAGGRCTVQGEASMLVGAVADPRPGELCLDVAAAPGGKATHLAERMGDRGRVVANDRSPERAALCAQSAARLGLGSVETRSGDARALPAEFGGRCDVVLADLPCTGFGTLAARPDLRWRRRPEDIATLAALQADLLAAAGRCVKPGGLLVYSTCTTEPEENEAVVAGFLADHAAFEPVDLRERVPAALRDEPGLEAGMLRLWPHVHDTEGFFIAALARRGGRARAGGERPAEPRS